MKYRMGMGFTMAVVISLLIGLTVVWAVDEGLQSLPAGVFNGNPAVVLKQKPTSGARLGPAAEPPPAAQIPTFFVVSVGLMMVTTTAIVTSKEMFPPPETE